MRSNVRCGLAGALLLAFLSSPPAAADPADPAGRKPPATASSQGDTDADERGWALFGRAVQDLREKYRNSASAARTEYEEQQQMASEVFGDMPAEELRQIKRISEMAEQAARAGNIYMLTPELQSFLGVPTWIAADSAGQAIARKVRDGRMSEDEAIELLEKARKATLESLEFFPALNELIEIGIEIAEEREEREGAVCSQWSLEISYSTPPSNPGEPPHTYRSEGTWTLQANTGEYHAWLTDPEMSNWAFAFNLPAGPLPVGQKIEFRSVEQEGIFHDSIGAWEGSVIDKTTMGGTFRYNSGGCCGNGAVSGNWTARCISAPQREGR